MNLGVLKIIFIALFSFMKYNSDAKEPQGVATNIVIDKIWQFILVFLMVFNALSSQRCQSQMIRRVGQKSFYLL